MTSKQALTWATTTLKVHQIPSPRLDAEILLSALFKKNREHLFTYPNQGLTSDQNKKYKILIRRRAHLEPLAYLTGHKEFYGLDFYVNKNVLVPRPETELIIEEVLNQVSSKEPYEIIDVGTGSGCIAITLAKLLPKIKIYATDIRRAALKIARKNVQNHKVSKRIKFLQGDLLTPIPKKFWQSQKEKIIIANLPYLNQQLLTSSPSIGYEPKVALSGGKDGLEVYREFIDQLKLRIADYGLRAAVLVEINPGQTKEIKKIIQEKFPKSKIQIKKDLSGLNRIVIFKI